MSVNLLELSELLCITSEAVGVVVDKSSVFSDQKIRRGRVACTRSFPEMCAIPLLAESSDGPAEKRPS